MRRGVFVIVGALLVALAPATAAQATVRYADPNGSTSGTCAPPDPPCTLQRAVEDPQTVDGDVVIVNPGDYLEGPDQLLIDSSISLQGAAGEPSPRIVSTSANNAVMVGGNATNAWVRRLTIEHDGLANALLLQAGSAEQIVVRSTRSACEISPTTTVTILRDSVCWTNDSQGNSALFVSTNDSGGTVTAYLRNVTAVATGSDTSGIFVWGHGSGANTAVDAQNVIARGAAADVFADADAGATATATLAHSNYVTEIEAGPGSSSITNPGTGTKNQTSSPLFADPTNGDFHQLAGSPTIDAGNASASMLGTLDIDGEERILGPAPDIGADESLDTSPPDTRITKRPPKKTKRKRATLKFIATEPGSTFECKLDRRPYRPCSSPKRYARLKPRRHVFRVRAKDAAGNVDPTPAAAVWRVKTTER